MAMIPTLANQTATDEFSQQYRNIEGKIIPAEMEVTAGTSYHILNKNDYLLVSSWGTVYVSGATIPIPPTTSSETMRLSNTTNTQSILREISTTPQEGTRLLEFSGAFQGNSEMSSDKKKHLDG